MSSASTDRRWLALVLLAAAQFVVVLDASIVNVALPTIGKGLNFSEENLPWVVNAYVIAFGGFLLLGGRAADLIGRRRVFLGGLAGFTVASVVCGAAQSQAVLIGARFVQGAGGALTSAVVLGMIVIGVLWLLLDRLVLAPLERATIERWGMVQRA